MAMPGKRISSISVVLLMALSLGACGDARSPGTDISTANESPGERGAFSDGGQSGSEERGAVRVSLRKFTFDPDPVRVSMGETVTWTNDDDILHTVTSGDPQEQGVPGVSENTDSAPDGLFDQPLEFGEEFSFTFEEKSDITYFCNVHPGMTGRIVVE